MVTGRKTINEVNIEAFKLIAFDIDGTLMGSDHIIHPFTKQTLFRLREKGFPFTLATGKNLPATISQADELEVDLPLVLINGGMLQKRNGDILNAVTLPEKIVHQVVAMCEANQRDLVMYIGDGIYYKAMNENISPVYGHLTSGLNPIGEWESINHEFGAVNKCLVVDTSNRDNLFTMGSLFEDKFHGEVDVLHTSYCLVEVMPKGVTKVSGLKKLAASLQISLNEVMAFGDFDNDVEMLLAAGLGAAVENASPRAKEAADIIVGSVDEQGPARFLSLLLDRLP